MSAPLSRPTPAQVLESGPSRAGQEVTNKNLRMRSSSPVPTDVITEPQTLTTKETTKETIPELVSMTSVSHGSQSEDMDITYDESFQSSTRTSSVPSTSTNSQEEMSGIQDAGTELEETIVFVSLALQLFIRSLTYL